MSKCIVTGGAGFIGSHLVDKLIENGHEVVVIDNLSLGRRKFINRKAEFYEKDITSLKDITPLFHGADVVFHLAADPRMQKSVEEPTFTHNTNVNGTLNVLEASRKANVNKVIFSSSAAVYGDVKSLPISENDDTRPKSPYPTQKLIGEQYSRLYSDLYGLKTVCLRYFNVYGPRKTTKGGYPMVIPAFLEKKKKGEPLTIVGDGKQTRDYVHVQDVVQANIQAWKSSSNCGTAYNIASEKQISVNKVADIIGGDVVHIEERPGEIRHMRADISKAKQDLNWEPKVGFETGLNKLIEHRKLKDSSIKKIPEKNLSLIRSLIN